MSRLREPATDEGWQELFDEEEAGADGLLKGEPLSPLQFSKLDKSKCRAGRAFRLCGSLAKHRPEDVIPKRCADAVVSRCELMMTTMVLKQ
jgi:hypothetical protein